MTIRLGTRGSALALAQTELAANALRLRGFDVQIVEFRKDLLIMVMALLFGKPTDRGLYPSLPMTRSQMIKNKCCQLRSRGFLIIQAELLT